MKSMRSMFQVGLVAAMLLVLPATSLADLSPSSVSGITVTGKVVDAATSIPLSGVYLETAGPTVVNTTTDGKGQFKLTGLSPGNYSILARAVGYDTTLSEEFSVSAGFSLPLTLALQRAKTTSGLRTLARTTVTAAASLQRASVIYQQTSGTELQKTAQTRAGDAIRNYGAVDNVSSNTASPGDDVYFSIRGIGSLETISLIDGHPIAFGMNDGNGTGLNYEMSPSFGLRAINVVYGAGGGDLYGVDAIGGVIDQQTLEPTRQQQIVVTQGYGTWSNLTSSLQATGSLDGNGRLGYGIALGVNSNYGPQHNLLLTQPAAAYDQSATAPAVVALQNYQTSSNLVNRSMLYKLRYGLGNNAHITLTSLNSYFWDNKTGNGDNDYQNWEVWYASGLGKLAAYTQPHNAGAITALNPPDCPAGTFLATNTSGAANGFGPDGVTPDGGVTCQTPGQYANFNAGWQGAGPAWQAFTLADYQARFDMTSGNNFINVNGFTDHYTHTYDRTWELPYISTPTVCDPAIAAAQGTVCTSPTTPANNCPCVLTTNPFWRNAYDTNTGFTATDSIVGQNNELGLGAYYNNTALLFTNTGAQRPSPIAHETSFFLRDAYHPISSPMTVYASAYFKHSTVTNSSFVDPRVAFVQTQGNEVYRAAQGWISTQPLLTQTAGPFVPGAPGALNGTVNCAGLNGIGSGGNPNLAPERASDTEFAYGHRFSGDSTIQLSLYTELIHSQIYTSIVPVSAFPSSFFGSTDLTAYTTKVIAQCPGITTTAEALTRLGVDSPVNIGTGLAEGYDLSGRQRLSREFFIDYEYAVNSVNPLSVPVSVLQNNLFIVPGSQLPRIPLQKANFSLDYAFPGGIEARSTTYFVAANNPNNLPGYNFTNFVLSYTAGRNTITGTVNNLFNQWASYQGLIGQGYPLPLNSFATAANYVPFFGSQATEQFGLPFRTLNFVYSYKLH